MWFHVRVLQTNQSIYTNRAKHTENNVPHIAHTLKQWSRGRCELVPHSTNEHIFSIPRKIKYTKVVKWIDLDKSGTRSCISRTELFTTHFFLVLPFFVLEFSTIAVWRRASECERNCAIFYSFFFVAARSPGYLCVLRSLHILHWISIGVVRRFYFVSHFLNCGWRVCFGDIVAPKPFIYLCGSQKNANNVQTVAMQVS